MGIEQEDGGMLLKDLEQVLDGHVPDGYKVIACDLFAIVVFVTCHSTLLWHYSLVSALTIKTAWYIA